MSVTEGTTKLVRSGVVADASFDASQRLTFDEEGRGGSPELIAVYLKAKELAQTLGHSTVEIPHLLLGFALTPEGMSCLKEAKIDASVVRRNCWMELAAYPSQPDAHNAITFSTDLRAINAIASSLARKNDSIARVVQTSHVLEALRDQKFNDAVTPLMVASRQAPTTEEIRQNVEGLKRYLEERLPLLEQDAKQVGEKLSSLASEMQERFSDTLIESQSICGAITSLQESFRGTANDKIRKIDNKLRNIKSIALFAAVLSAVNIATLLAIAVLLKR